MTKQLVATALTTLLLYACAIPIGEKIDVASAERVVVGTTTKSEIIAKFGQPPVRNSTQGFDIWTYQYQIEKGNIFSGTTGHDTTTLSVTFKGDVVARCRITLSNRDNLSLKAPTMDAHECGNGAPPVTASSPSRSAPTPAGDTAIPPPAPPLPVVQAPAAQPPTMTVAQAQARLKTLGFAVGQADGVMGPKTRSELKRFQKSRGIAESGELDPDTIAALK